MAYSMGKASSAWTVLEKGQETLVLEVGPGGIVTGTVRHKETGAPVAQARVYLRIGRGHQAFYWWTDSASNGAYRFEGVPMGMLAIPAPDDNFRFRNEELDIGMMGDEEEEAAIAGGATKTFARVGERFERDLRVTPRAGIEVTYRIRPAPGGELPEVLGGTQVWVSSGGRWTMGFEEEMDTEDPKVVRFLPAGANTLTFETKRYWAALPARKVRGSGAPDETVVTLRPKAKVFVQLIGEDGEPLRQKDVEVTVWRISGGGGSGETYRTDAEGRCDVSEHLPPPSLEEDLGVHTAVEVRGEGFFKAGSGFPNLRVTGPELLKRVEAAGGDPIVFRVPARSWMPLVIQTVDERGKPVAGVRLVARDAKYFEVPCEGTTDADGRFELKIREADPFGGRFGVIAGAPWWGELRLDDALKYGERSEDGAVLMKLVSARKLTFRLLDESGVPIANTRATLGRRSGVTDADGTVTLHTAPNDRRRVLETEGYLDRSLEFEPGDQAMTLNLVRGRRVRVTIPVPEGATADVACAWPSGQRMGETIFLRRRGDEYVGAGDVKWEGFALEVSTKDGLFCGRVECPEGTRSAKLTLSPRPMAPVKLRFVDGSGKPAANSAVTITKHTGSWTWLVRTGRTNANGVVTVDLPPTKGAWLQIEMDRWKPADRRQRPYSAPTEETVEIAVSPHTKLAVRLDFRKAGREIETDTLTAVLIRPDGSEEKVDGTLIESHGTTATVTLGVRAHRGRLRITANGRSFEVPFDGVPEKVPVLVWE
jgi:5-hydroxyisourate hydrolase-like protein (transthyretin family)